jgi:hypothetical protein
MDTGGLFTSSFQNAVLDKSDHLSNALAEGVNSRIQHLIQKACGYRNRERFKRDVLFHLGGLNLYPEFVQ